MPRARTKSAATKAVARRAIPGEEMIERDRQIVAKMAEHGPMPLDYMEMNMRWYFTRAKYYEEQANTARKPKTFRRVAHQKEQERKIERLQSMADRMRAAGQAAAEAAANYSHAKIQSVSIGNSRGAKQVVVVLSGDEAKL